MGGEARVVAGFFFFTSRCQNTLQKRLLMPFHFAGGKVHKEGMCAV